MTATTIKTTPITKSTAPPPITPFAARCLATAPAPPTLTVHDGWTVTKVVVVATRLHDGWIVILGMPVARLHDGWSVPVLVTTAACNIFIVTSLVLLVVCFYTFLPFSATQPTSCICQQNHAVDWLILLILNCTLWATKESTIMYTWSRDGGMNSWVT